jgi:hypothetical protein
MAVTTIDYMKRKRGRCDPSPINRSLEWSGCPFLFHRDRLGLFHWLGLVVFERDDFLRPGSQLRVMLFRIFRRKPIDRGEPIRFRCCSDFRSRHDRFPCQSHDNLTDRIGRRFRSADGLRPDDARVKAGQFLFGHFSRPCDVVVRVSLRRR